MDNRHRRDFSVKRMVASFEYRGSINYEDARSFGII